MIYIILLIYKREKAQIYDKQEIAKVQDQDKQDKQELTVLLEALIQQKN